MPSADQPQLQSNHRLYSRLPHAPIQANTVTINITARRFNAIRYLSNIPYGEIRITPPDLRMMHPQAFERSMTFVVSFRGNAPLSEEGTNTKSYPPLPKEYQAAMQSYQ